MRIKRVGITYIDIPGSSIGKFSGILEFEADGTLTLQLHVSKNVFGYIAHFPWRGGDNNTAIASCVVYATQLERARALRRIFKINLPRQSTVFGGCDIFHILVDQHQCHQTHLSELWMLL